MSELVTCVVLAGGRSTRFGADKLAAPMHGRSLLDLTLGSLPPHWPVVCVGPPRTTERAVTWTREDPPGGGPLCGVNAALAHVATPLTLVVAGDMPYAGAVAAELVEALLDAPADILAVAAEVTDADGSRHANPLLAAYRTAALPAAIPGDGRDRAARELLRVLPHRLVAVPGRPGRDVDTPHDLEDLQ